MEYPPCLFHWRMKSHLNVVMEATRMNSLNEPSHDKTNKMTVRPANTQISLASAQSDQSLRYPHEETLGP